MASTDTQNTYVDEAYYPWLRLGTQYASFMRATGQGTDIYIYYQDHFTKLNELHYSAKDHRWGSTAIDTGKILPQPGTSLAVLNWGESIRLYYITTEWLLSELYRDHDGGDWKTGNLNAKVIKAHPESSLSAVFHQSKATGGGHHLYVLFQNTYLNIQSTIWSESAWSDATDLFTAAGGDPRRAMLGSSLAFANIGTLSVPRFVGFYQTDGGQIQEISWTGEGSWGQGLTNVLFNSVDDTSFRTPLAVSALHYDSKNTLQLAYVKDGAVYHDQWEEGKGWTGSPLLVKEASSVIKRPGGITISSRTFSAGGIKCHLYTSSPPNALGGSILDSSANKWVDSIDPIPLFTKHTVKVKVNLLRPTTPPPPPPPPPAKKTVEGVFNESLRNRSKIASVILDETDPDRQYCVIYQKNDDSIVVCRFDPNTQQWTEQEAVPKGVARAGTPIAATATDGYDGCLAISVYYITPQLKLGNWATGYFGPDVWRDYSMQANDVHPATDLCCIKGGKYGYEFLFYQAPDGTIREIASMGDWYDLEIKQPALPGTSLAFVDNGPGEKPYQFSKSGVFQAPDGSLKQITQVKDSQYDFHDWQAGELDIKLPDTSFLTPLSCAVTRSTEGIATMHLFHVDSDSKIVEVLYNDEKGWHDPPEEHQQVSDWRLPPGGSISAAPHYWYNKDDEPPRLYASAPLNAIAEFFGGGSDGWGPKDYEKSLVGISGDTVKVDITI